MVVQNCKSSENQECDLDHGLLWPNFKMLLQKWTLQWYIIIALLINSWKLPALHILVIQITVLNLSPPPFNILTTLNECCIYTTNNEKNCNLLPYKVLLYEPLMIKFINSWHIHIGVVSYYALMNLVFRLKDLV